MQKDRNQVMSREEIELEALSSEIEIEISEAAVELPKMEAMPTAKVTDLESYRRAMGYSK